MAAAQGTSVAGTKTFGRVEMRSIVAPRVYCPSVQWVTGCVEKVCDPSTSAGAKGRMAQECAVREHRARWVFPNDKGGPLVSYNPDPTDKTVWTHGLRGPSDPETARATREMIPWHTVGVPMPVGMPAIQWLDDRTWLPITFIDEKVVELWKIAVQQGEARWVFRSGRVSYYPDYENESYRKKPTHNIGHWRYDVGPQTESPVETESPAENESPAATESPAEEETV